MKKIIMVCVLLMVASLLCSCNEVQNSNSFESCNNIQNSETKVHECYFVHNSKIEPTCTQSGKIHWYCKECGKSYDETLPPLGHNYVKAGNSSAWKDGSGVYRVTAYYQCTRCGSVRSEDH